MKLALARTLLLERETLSLDEPTLGLDVKTINLFINIIKNFENTIIFASHILSVFEKICDRIAFINEGKIIKRGTQEQHSPFCDIIIMDYFLGSLIEI